LQACALLAAVDTITASLKILNLHATWGRAIKNEGMTFEFKLARHVIVSENIPSKRTREGVKSLGALGPCSNVGVQSKREEYIQCQQTPGVNSSLRKRDYRNVT